MATLHQLAQLDRSGLALNQRKHTNTVVVKSMIVILKNVYKTKIRTQVQLETQVTPVLPQQRLAKFVDDDLMLCHRRQSERERESERARQCLQTKQIGERDTNTNKQKPEYLKNISETRTDGKSSCAHSWPASLIAN